MVFQANQGSPGSPQLSEAMKPARHMALAGRSLRAGLLVPRARHTARRTFYEEPLLFFFQTKRIKEACSYCSLMFFACVCLCILMHHDIFGHTGTAFFKMNYNMDVRSVAEALKQYVLSFVIWNRGVGNSWAMF